MVNGYVLKYATGEYVELNANTEGYPYPVEEIFKATIYRNKDDAVHALYHASSFGDLQKVIFEISFTEREVVAQFP